MFTNLFITPQEFSKLASDPEWCQNFQQYLSADLQSRVRRRLEWDLLDLALKSEEGCKILAENCMLGPGPVTEHQDYVVIMNHLYDRNSLTAEEIETSPDFIRFLVALEIAAGEKIKLIYELASNNKND